jgi:AcrR family transcriptional regulator
MSHDRSSGAPGDSHSAAADAARPVSDALPPDAGSDLTRDRLVLAAGEAFARTGFEATSVRAICDAAGVNVSAVKYHFGSKAMLYRAVWDLAAAEMFRGEPMPTLEEELEAAELAGTPGIDARDLFVRFIRWFMRLVLTEAEDHAWVGRLLAHETIHPTAEALETFVARCAGPMRAELRRIVIAIVGTGMQARTIDDLTNSIIGVCVNQKHSCEILTRLGFPPPRAVADVDRLAETVAGFALSGLDGFARTADAERPAGGGPC